MTHEYEFSMSELSEYERESLDDTYIEMVGGRMSALEIMWGMQHALDEYKTRLDQMRAVNASLSSEKEQSEHNLRAAHNSARKELAYRCQVMRDIARLLAECGGYDHKTKNEVLLRAIGMLLTYDNPVTEFTRNMGEIPF